MNLINQRFLWTAVLGGLVCLSVGNGTAAQEKSTRDQANRVDEPIVQQVAGTTFDDICPGNGFPPPCDDATRSMGSFTVLVSPRWRKNMIGCPSSRYDPATGLLTSDTLNELFTTVIGRSATHLDGPGPPDAAPGTPVGKPLTAISDASFSVVPAGFEGPPGTREVHTELFAMFLTDGAGSNVRAGVHAPAQPISPGEVESNSGASGDSKLDFPAESFFNMFVEVDIPGCGAFPGATVYNVDPLLVTNSSLQRFPPQVIYIHGETSAVGVLFRTPSAKWVPGQRFGWLVLAGHGTDVDPGTFEEVMASADLMQAPPTVECDGTESGGTGVVNPGCGGGPRLYAYPVSDPNGTLTDVYIGTHDNDPANYTNWCMPTGWNKTIERNDKKKLSHAKLKTPHGVVSPGADGFCPYVIHFKANQKVKGLPKNGFFTFGFDNPNPSHDVEWQADENDKAPVFADWTRDVGGSLGPVHGPWLPKKDVKVGVIIGNNNYAGCANDLPGVLGDVLNKQNALDNAGWKLSIEPNQKAAEMWDAINNQFVWGGAYIVWYAGHGSEPRCKDGDRDGLACCPNGTCSPETGLCKGGGLDGLECCPGDPAGTCNPGGLTGVDCQDLTPQDLVDALKDDSVRSNTLVILDSCYGADFANAVNWIDPTIGFITGAEKGQCTFEDEDGQKGRFSRCFVQGLNGPANVGDTGEGPGNITVEEAVNYVTLANCDWLLTTPTWDGDHAGWVIGATKTPPVLDLCTPAKEVCDGGDRDGKNCCAADDTCVTGNCVTGGQECCPLGACVVISDRNAGCWSGCLTCDPLEALCSDTPVNLPLVEETNFSPVHLALVQADFKINHYQEAVVEILLKQKPSPKKIEKVGNVQDAIAAILHDFNKQGAAHVVIFGHGSPGHFKIGKDDLADPVIQDKFTKGLAGMLKTLTLYGCEVGKDAEGQAFLKKLTAELKRPVHTWTGKVYAFPNKWPDGTAVPAELANKFMIESATDKKDIPAVTEWGMVVMLLLVLAAGTIVIRRSRAVRALS